MDPITVLIVDDHTVAREGLRAMLETDPQVVKVVGEATDGIGALERVSNLHPQVVLMDVRMPGMGGLEATRRIKAEFPATSIVMITSYDDNPLMVDAVVAGAAGFLLKDTSRDLLIHTLGAVANGGILIKDTLLRKAINTLTQAIQPPQSAPSEHGLVEELTRREQDILGLIADGQTNKEIADVLALAEATVKKHVQTIIAKLRASDRTQAATTGLRIGLIR